jgi:hypothetical protein
MKRHYRIPLLLCSLCTASLTAVAQNTTNLPTSMYGVGELSAGDGGRYAGMGNTGIALNRTGFLNTLNPAAITCMQHSSRILLTVDKHFSFQQENYNIFLTLSRRQMESSGVGSIYYCIVHSLGTLSALFFTSASRRVGHRQVDLFVCS